jgi:hypothetical protein
MLRKVHFSQLDKYYLKERCQNLLDEHVVENETVVRHKNMTVELDHLY